MHLFHVILILTGIHLSSVDADSNKYGSLISDVRNKYSTSSVFFMFSRKNSQLQEYTLAHLLTRTFSEQGVFTLVTHFDDLNDRLNYYRRRIGRPLIVIVLRSLDDIAEFRETIPERIETFPIWLVIFHGRSGNPLCEYCRRPIGNPFGLRFDTLMLVLCCDNPTIHEWWSFDGNRTEIGKIGNWTANKKLDLIPEGLNARRNNVRGITLRVVIVENSPIVDIDGDHIGGFFGTVLHELERSMNFTSKILRVDGYGSYDPATKRWSGAIGLLARREADLAVPTLTMTASRLDVVDFTSPLFLSRIELFIREPDSIGLQWFAYFQALTLKIWIILIVLMITSPLLLALIQVKKSSKHLGSIFSKLYLNVWGIFCQQGLSELPTRTSLRIAYFSIFVSAFVVYVAYSGSLISFLTVTSSGLPFTDLRGFVKDGSYKLIVSQKSSDYEFFKTSTEGTFKEMMKLMKPWKDLPSDPTKAWEQVCSDRVALFTNKMQWKALENSMCKVVGIATGRVDSLAMALPAGSQYTDVVNYHLERFKTSGMLARLTAKYYPQKVVTEKTYDVVELFRVAPILVILAIGIMLGFIVICCEILYYSRKDFKESRSNQDKSRKIRAHGSLESPRTKPLRTNVPRPRPPLRNQNIDPRVFGYYP